MINILDEIKFGTRGFIKINPVRLLKKVPFDRC